MDREQVIVVGAGISGILLARRLQAEGANVTVLEKSRGFGGRMATRRWDDQRFDHGAQYFRIRSPQAKDAIQPLIDAGVVVRWPGGDGAGSGEDRWIGRPGMSAVARALAGDLRVIHEARVLEAVSNDGGWNVRLADGGELACRVLALTSPVPQSLAILRPALNEMDPVVRLRLEGIEYEPAYALLAKLEGPARGSWRSGLQLSDERIAWVADNQSKLRPGEDGDGALVAQSTPHFARKQERSEREVVAGMMARSVEALLGVKLREQRAHWWKFASPSSRLAERAVWSGGPSPAVFCGDAFGEGMIEGALLSGLAASELVLGRSAQGEII